MYVISMSTTPTPSKSENQINVNATYKGERKVLVLQANQNFKDLIEAVRSAFKIERTVELDAKKAGAVISREEGKSLKDLNVSTGAEIEILAAIPKTQ